MRSIRISFLFAYANSWSQTFAHFVATTHISLVAIAEHRLSPDEFANMKEWVKHLGFRLRGALAAPTKASDWSAGVALLHRAHLTVTYCDPTLYDLILSHLQSRIGLSLLPLRGDKVMLLACYLFHSTRLGEPNLEIVNCISNS